MKNRQKMSLLTLGVCVTLAATSYASGAPTSQFGFTGWPYRQQTGCGSQATQPDCTAAPTQTTAPTHTVSPDHTAERPSCPTYAPQTEPPAQAPAATPVPEPTDCIPPECTAAPTEAPEATATQAPTVTPTNTATPAPTDAPTPTKAPEATQKPVEPTPSPSIDDDYTTGSVTAQEENAFLLLNADRSEFPK